MYFIFIDGISRSRDPFHKKHIYMHNQCFIGNSILTAIFFDKQSVNQEIKYIHTI